MAQHSVVAARNKLYRSQSIYHTEFRLSFRRICYKLEKIWDSKVDNFNKEMYVMGQLWLRGLAYISL